MGRLSFLLLLPLFSAPLFAAEGDLVERVGKAVFGVAEKELIRAYFERRPESAEAFRERDEADDVRRDDDEDGKGKGKDKGKEKGKGGGRGDGLPPGLAKRERLPPGLERQLERNGRLPPGLEGRALPEELERTLPPPPKGAERVVVGSDVVLVERAGGLILDIMRDVMDVGGKN